MRQKKKTQLQDATNSFLYNHLDELPLITFLRCICYREYHLLGKGDVKEHWEKLYLQYLDLMGDRNLLYSARLQYDIAILNYNISRVDGIVKAISALSVLRERGLEFETKEITSSLGVNFLDLKIDENIDDVSVVTQKLNMVITRSKRLLVEREMKIKELDALNKRGNDRRSDDELMKSFSKLIVAVSKHMKFHINKNEISTLDFMNMVSDMRDTYKMLNNGK